MGSFVLFLCPGCGKRLKANPNAIGKKALCRGCGQALRVPGARFEERDAPLELLSEPSQAAPPRPPSRFVGKMGLLIAGITILIAGLIYLLWRWPAQTLLGAVVVGIIAASAAGTSTTRRRVTQCYRCKRRLDSASHSKCETCGWIRCPGCAACGCGYGSGNQRQRSRQPPATVVQPPPGEPIDISDEFLEALDLIENHGQSMFVTGTAGTGKSTLLRYFRDTTKKNAVVLASRGSQL
jgi:hypothetical protein